VKPSVLVGDFQRGVKTERERIIALLHFEQTRNINNGFLASAKQINALLKLIMDSANESH